MKKILFISALCIIAALNCSCKKTVTSNMDVEVLSENDEKLTCNVIASDDVVELFNNDYESYECAINAAASKAKYDCTFPSTFVPEHFIITSVSKTKGDNYTMVIGVYGKAKNGFGVEGTVNETVNLNFDYTPSSGVVPNFEETTSF